MYVEDPEGGNSMAMLAGLSHAAGILNYYAFAPGSRTMGTAITGYVTNEMPSSLILTPGDRFASDVWNIQVGDAFAEIYLAVEAFMLP